MVFINKESLWNCTCLNFLLFWALLGFLVFVCFLCRSWAQQIKSLLRKQLNKSRISGPWLKITFFFQTVAILTCQSRKDTGGINNIKDVCISFGWVSSRALVQCWFTDITLITLTHTYSDTQRNDATVRSVVGSNIFGIYWKKNLFSTFQHIIKKRKSAPVGCSEDACCEPSFRWTCVSLFWNLLEMDRTCWLPTAC